MLRLLDLCSGIGGFSLAARLVGGYQTVAFCEIDPFCRTVLARHWPGIPCYDNVTTITGMDLRADGIVPVDLVTAGFPCQDISNAGTRAGLHGARSGLFFEIARLVGEIGPRWVLLENVSALRTRGLPDVLHALDALGYDASWHLVPASAVGAPHLRDRCWIVALRADAYSRGRTRFGIPQHANVQGSPRPEPDRLGAGRRGQGETMDAANADRERLAFWMRFREHLATQLEAVAGGRHHWSVRYAGRPTLAPSELCRVADGISGGLDSVGQRRIGPRDVRCSHRAALTALGNAVVPQVAGLFLKAILSCENGPPVTDQ